MPRPRDSSASAPLRALLGAFATYHRAGTDDPLPEGVVASLDPAPFDARVFASHAVLTARVSRWDADELGREIVAHAWDLRPEARDRLNPALLGAALDAARSRTGIRVSNRGGAFHSRPDALATLAPTLPAATFLTQLIEGAVAQAAAALPRRGDPSRAARSPQRVTTSWHNVSRGNGEDAHGLHDHAGARWSGAYYVAVPPDIARDPPPLATTTETTETRRRIRTRRSGRFERFEAFRSVSTTTKEKDEETRSRDTSCFACAPGEGRRPRGEGSGTPPAGGACTPPSRPSPVGWSCSRRTRCMGCFRSRRRRRVRIPHRRRRVRFASPSRSTRARRTSSSPEGTRTTRARGLEGFGRDAEKRTAEE